MPGDAGGFEGEEAGIRKRPSHTFRNGVPPRSQVNLFGLQLLLTMVETHAIMLKNKQFEGVFGMSKLLSLLLLVAFLGLAVPVQAQFRNQAHTQQAAAKLYNSDGPAFSLNKLFSPDHFRMQHSYEMSFGSFGGQTNSLGMYTNSMLFQFNPKLAARVDVSVAHSLLGNQVGNQFGMEGNGAKVFLRNAEIAYRPKENVQLHLSVRQSPYGSYMGPYGYHGYNPYYSGFGATGGELFWNSPGR